jgi:membrane dipeptidase
MRLLSVPTLALLLAIPASAQHLSDVSAADRAAHQRMIVLDTHLDIPERWDDGSWDFGMRHDVHEDGSQVDLPRMD